MKKFLLLAVASVSFSTGLFAQKYLTRTGKVTMFSSTKLENFESFNNETSAVLDAKTGDAIVIVPIKSFKFESALMEEHFNENYLESDKYPKADFKGKITNIGEVNFAKDGVYNVKASGKLTMHGVTNDVNIPGTVTVKGGAITAVSKFMINPNDYKIKIPKLMAGKVADQIEITVNCIMNQK
jgi:hypothetical protein